MQPIYEQIVMQIKSAIMCGELKEGQALPSVRTLSKELKVSALTVKKAYDALDEEGFIVTVHGKGSFVNFANQNLMLEEKKKEMAAKQAELDAKAKEAQELLATLLAKGDEYDAMLDAQEEELAKLEQEIAQKQEEYDEAKYQEWRATSVPPTTKPPAVNIGGGVGGSASNTQGLTWLVPCDYKYVSSAFGWRWHPVHGDWRFHAGVDLAIGHTPIYATRAGIVETATYSSSAGYYVVINHMDGYKSTYMHMCKFPSVKQGEMVTAGQVIGCVGTTGTSTGYHLHFGISQNGVNLNPMDFIG
jgi:murein DD-endopeptidase MepM/ murein hydrolase activator NlpD